MKTIGIGVDIVSNKRIKSSIKNKKFINRIFGKNEILNSKKILNQKISDVFIFNNDELIHHYQRKRKKETNIYQK